MKKYLALLAAPIALAMPVVATAQSVGDWVLSPWRDSEEEYPGVVIARSGDTVTIRFDDGSTESRFASDVRPFDWRAGTGIVCQWTDGQWYNATIIRISDDGYTMRVNYEDGTTESTNTGKCRTR